MSRPPTPVEGTGVPVPDSPSPVDVYGYQRTQYFSPIPVRTVTRLLDTTPTSWFHPLLCRPGREVPSPVSVCASERSLPSAPTKSPTDCQRLDASRIVTRERPPTTGTRGVDTRSPGESVTTTTTSPASRILSSSNALQSNLSVYAKRM